MRKDISIILVILIAISFFFRIGSIKKEHPLTYDEIVYPALAAQKAENPANYNTIGIYNRALSKGQKLPEYFKKPLFKHPPLFPDLIRISYALFGRTYLSAGKVSLLFGVLLIAIAYLLGSLLFDSRVGVYAALLMSIEPVSWICSQKIWMETTLAFFTVLALYLFALAKEKYNPWIMIGSGVAAGLAALTKYPGFLATGIILAYTLCSERRLFRKKAFIFSLFVPFLMILPWLLWNYRVYGAGLFNANVEISYLLKRAWFFIKRFWPYLVLIGAVPAFIAFIKNKKIDIYQQKILPKINILTWAFVSVLFLVIVFLIRYQLLNALDLRHVPEAGWKIGMFTYEPWYFYLGRLVELSPFYIFSYLALFLFVADKDNFKKHFFLFLGASVVLFFYMLWRNYQCRYITASIVPLIVLSAKAQFFILDSINKIGSTRMKLAVKIIAFLVVFYMAAKTVLVDVELALPNSICYF
jgi:4-amino-4-deoxy-L-arabinose transferase-like glycosyltransferase